MEEERDGIFLFLSIELKDILNLQENVYNFDTNYQLISYLIVSRKNLLKALK